MVRTERQWKSVKMAPLPKEVSAPTTKALDPSAVKALNVSPAQILFRRQEQLDITTKVSLAIPPRRMWGCDAGGGYCGECSFQTALLYFGNYCSQERVRYVASNQELLIGIHDEKVADKFLLNSDSVSMPGEAMLNWIVPHITAGHLVIAGWVGYIEGGEHADEYDHIMPIVGVEYDTTGKGKLKVSAMEYHDLYYNRVCRATRNDDEPTSHGPLLTSNKEAIARRKKQWDSDDDDDSDDSDDEEDDGETTDNSGVFDPEEDKDFYVFPAHKAYAVAVTGVHDERDELKRCVLQVSSWEEPDWGAENEKDRKPRRLQATLTVLGLTEGNPYAVLRFDDIKDVPKAGNFLASQKWSKCFTFTASGESVSLPNFDTLATNGTYFYRVVDFAPEAV